MIQTLERLWVSALNSNSYRRFVAPGLRSVVLHSPVYRQLDLARRYLITSYQVRKNPALFQDVQTFCLFIGHNKSGSSMLGSLLDAHPNVILADEADALQFVPAGFSRDQIYHILLHVSRREFLKGRVTARRLQPYSYLVPGQWQGRYTTLRVIGDSTTGTSTQRFAKDPALVQRLQETMKGAHVKFIQVIRNPFDPISVMMVRGKRTFENAIEHYFANCETLVEMRKRLDSSNLIAMKYEDFIDQPEANLAELCRFLGVDASADYLKACVSILRKTPDRSRQMVEWDSKWIGTVQSKIDRFDFLRGYSFEH